VGEIPSCLGNLNLLTGLTVNQNNLSGCFHPNLLNLCDKLNQPSLYIDVLNDFDARWDDFCSSSSGICNRFVWPGDFDNNGIVEINDILHWGAAYNKTGPTRPNANINWVGQDCEDWQEDINGINGKHQDGNGNGVVDTDDIFALIQNLGQTHSYYSSSGVSSSLQFKLMPDMQANGASSNDNIFEYDLYVEDDGNTVSAHGVSASIFFGGLNVVSADINVTNSSLNPDESRVHFDAVNNTLHIGLTKTSGTNTALNGTVCRVMVEILEIDSGESFAFNINSGGGVMQANGEMQKVSGTTIYDTNPGSGISLNASASHANCENGGSALVNAFGGNGNYCYEWNTGESTQEITDLSPGIYSVLVCDDNGVSNSIEVEVQGQFIEVQGQFIPVYDENGDIVPCNTFTACPTVIDFEDYVPDGTHQANNVIHTKADLENGYNVVLKAGNMIRLTSGFSSRGSHSFKVRTEDCE